MKTTIIVFTTSLTFLISGCMKASLEQVRIPERNINSVGGGSFLRLTATLPTDKREEAIYREVTSGNLPNFLRRMKTLHLSAVSPSGQKLSGKILVMTDYLSIGSEKDFVTIPMNPITAQRIADQFGLNLPTRHLVNKIYQASQIKLTPQPMRPSADMVSNRYYLHHHNSVYSTLDTSHMGKLMGGHKKDIVISNKLLEINGRVAIYGWHQTNGKAIQPLSTVHDNLYADYSHGIRFVGKIVQVNGKNYPIEQVLSHPEMHVLLSDEGMIHNPRIEIPTESDALSIPQTLLSYVK